MDNELEVVVDGIIYQKQSHGGISRLYSEILPRMCELDDSLHITLLTKGTLKQALPEHAHITHRVVPSARRHWRPRRFWGLVTPSVRRFEHRLRAKRSKDQIWHSTYYTLPEHWGGRQVVTVVDMIHERFADLLNGPGCDQFREQKRHCVQEADAVICISETTGQDVQHFYGLDSDSLHVVPLACSDVFRQLGQGESGLEMPTREPFLLYVGTRSHHKNFDKLLQAYSVWKHKKHVPLTIVGPHWSAGEEQRLADLGIRDRVHLSTDVDDEGLCQLYNQATAFVYPSLYEGFGIPLLESMACGCPIVASRIPSTVEVAGECSIYFGPTDVKDILIALDAVLSEGRNSERVQAGLKHVRRYSWERTARQTLEVYYALSNSG